MQQRHRVGQRALGPDGIAARGLDDAKEAEEEERRGDGHVGKEAQRWQHSEDLGDDHGTVVP